MTILAAPKEGKETLVVDTDKCNLTYFVFNDEDELQAFMQALVTLPIGKSGKRMRTLLWMEPEKLAKIQAHPIYGVILNIILELDELGEDNKKDKAQSMIDQLQHLLDNY